MPKMSEDAMEERRAQIITAAMRVFAEKGLSHATLRDVFREAGLSAGAVYNYFNSKEDLILAVTEAGMAQVVAALGSITSGKDNLDEIISGFLSMLGRMDPSKQPRVDLMIAAEALASPAVRKVVIQNRSAVRAALLRLIEQRQAAGRWKGHSASALADLMYATYQGLILSVALGEKPNLAKVAGALKAMDFD